MFLFQVYTGEREAFRKAQVSVSPCYITICPHFKIKYSNVTSESSVFPSQDGFLSGADFLCFEKAFKPFHVMMPFIPRPPLSKSYLPSPSSPPSIAVDFIAFILLDLFTFKLPSPIFLFFFPSASSYTLLSQ